MRQLLPVSMALALLPLGCLGHGVSAVGFVAARDCGSCAAGAGSNDATGCSDGCCGSECRPWRSDLPNGPFGWLDDLSLKFKVKKCADEALDEIENATGHEPSDDFEDGFEQAFVDLAMGRSGATPPVPPPKYWNAYYRAPIGHHSVREWYAGYELGVQRAIDLGIADSTVVLSSHAGRQEFVVPAMAPNPRPVPQSASQVLLQSRATSPASAGHSGSPEAARIYRGLGWRAEQGYFAPGYPSRDSEAVTPGGPPTADDRTQATVSYPVNPAAQLADGNRSAAYIRGY